MTSLDMIFTVLLLAGAGFFYTMAGFAGGSTFTAILLLVGLSAGQSALGGLVFNVFSTLSSITRWKAHISREFLWFIAGSVPAAFLTGLLVLPDVLLRLIMGIVITVGGLSIIVITYPLRVVEVSWPLKITIGAVIGIVAGLTGIGGGVYLAPVLILAGMAKPKTSAATTTVFIMLNSLSGIIARTPRLGTLLFTNPLLLWAIPALLIAGQLGSYLGSRRFSQTNVRRTIGLVLITVGAYIAVTSL
jgi:uncharacterized membrane protein YfcA